MTDVAPFMDIKAADLVIKGLDVEVLSQYPLKSVLLADSIRWKVTKFGVNIGIHCYL